MDEEGFNEDQMCDLEAMDTMLMEKERKEIILLGKKTFWWKVRIVTLLSFWLLSTSPTRKSWSEFKYGLIKHDCEWDEDNPEKDQYCTWLSCKHHGCNLVHPIKYS